MTKGDPGARAATILAVTGDDDRYVAVRRHAMELAAREGLALILYDWDAPTFMGDPLPTWWSGQGSEDLFSRRLDETRLRAAGRATIADQLVEAAALGIPASGWLPSEHGPGALAAYASEEAVSTIFIPESLQNVSGMDGLLHGTNQAKALDSATAARVVAILDGGPAS